MNKSDLLASIPAPVPQEQMPWLPPLPIPVKTVRPLSPSPEASPFHPQPRPLPAGGSGAALRLLLVPAYAALLGAAGSAAYFYLQAERLTPAQAQVAPGAPTQESLARQAEETEHQAEEIRNNTRRAEEERARTEKQLTELRSMPLPAQNGTDLAAELKQAEAELNDLRRKIAEAERARIITGREPKSEDERILVTLANGMLSAINQGKKDILDIIFENEVRKGGKKLTKASAVKSITDRWKPYPTRRCKPMGLGLGKNRVELLYSYCYTDTAGNTTRGYAKQTWLINEHLRIIDYREENSEKNIYLLSPQVEAVNIIEKE